MKNLPDLSGIFDQFKLRDWLEEISPDKTILGFTIKLALKEGKPLAEIIATILDHYHDNPEAVVDIVGYGTMTMIKRLTKTAHRDDLKDVRFGQ